MEDPEWEARRSELIADIGHMPPARIELLNGDELWIVAATSSQAKVVHDITHEAFTEFRGVLDPPNGSDSESPEDVASQILAGGALIGYLAGCPAASLRISINPDHLYVGRVGVVPAFRGKGIGKAMLRHAERVAAHLQLPEVRLGTREKLTDNVALYLKLGYTIDRVVPHARGSDMVVLFVKRVSPND